MTVGELIQRLQDMPPNLIVGYRHYRQDGDFEFNEVQTVRLGSVEEIETWGQPSGQAVLLNE